MTTILKNNNKVTCLVKNIKKLGPFRQSLVIALQNGAIIMENTKGPSSKLKMKLPHELATPFLSYAQENQNYSHENIYTPHSW